MNKMFPQRSRETCKAGCFQGGETGHEVEEAFTFTSAF